MRTVKGAARNQAKKRLFQKVKGFVGGRRRLLRTAKETLRSRGRLCLSRPPQPQARVPQAVDHPHQRGRPRARPELQRVHRRADQGRDRTGPQDPRRPGRDRSGGLRSDRGRGERGAGEVGPSCRKGLSVAGRKAARGLHAVLIGQSRSTHASHRCPKSDLASMALAEFLAELDQLCREAQAAFDAAGDAAALEAARIEFLGVKSGRLKAVQKGLGAVDKADKPGRRQALQRGQAADRGGLRSGRRRGWPAAPARRPPARSSIPRCPASARGWAICTRSRKRSRNSRTSWAGWGSPWSTGRRSKTSGTISRP